MFQMSLHNQHFELSCQHFCTPVKGQTRLKVNNNHFTSQPTNRAETRARLDTQSARQLHELSHLDHIDNHDIMYILYDTLNCPYIAMHFSWPMRKCATGTALFHPTTPPWYRVGPLDKLRGTSMSPYWLDTVPQ